MSLEVCPFISAASCWDAIINVDSNILAEDLSETALNCIGSLGVSEPLRA